MAEGIRVLDDIWDRTAVLNAYLSPFIRGLPWDNAGLLTLPGVVADTDYEPEAETTEKRSTRDGLKKNREGKGSGEGWDGEGEGSGKKPEKKDDQGSSKELDKEGEGTKNRVEE
ncbi:hypothetical protein K466DRAFT_602245 [Polyporus arcularius HHB13444]|uniref:Uncharacterized protein n=1 Tax=Polyporus arcularius HHB13444 TaxID=1314778 RepID=A0A5C3PE64_9APHY|nr:hypothetical protein K466DRAFT_602245 [Polyporus arcularius HHB13444]